MTAAPPDARGMFGDLAKLVSPGSIALIGGSDKPGSIGARTLENLTTFSAWDGRLSVINPGRKSVSGMDCLPSVGALDHVPDVACLAIRADQVVASLEECAAHGIKFAVVFAPGFGETGEEGQLQEQRMRDIVARSGMRIYGPNCPGINNLNARLGLTFSPAFRFDHRAGPVGLATQGGGLGRSFLQGMDRGLGVGLWCSSGNEVDLEVSDFIHYMAGADDIKVIATTIEGVRNGRKFTEAALAAARKGKPIVAIRVGKSAYGVRAAQSHTAAISGSSEINAAVFRELGIIEVEDVDEMIDVASLLARGRPSGKEKIAVYCFSGGSGALAADLVGTHGLEMSEFTASTRQALKEVLPAFASILNPVDVTGEVLSNPGLCHASLKVTAEDDNTGIVLVPIPFEYGEITTLLCASLVGVQPEVRSLIVPVWMTDRIGEGYKTLVDDGMTPIRSISGAVKAVGHYIAYGAWRASFRQDWEPLCAPPAGDFSISSDTEPVAKNFLASHGLATPEGMVVDSAAKARQAFIALGSRPVAMKIVSRLIAHKTNVGGVALDIRTADDAASSYESIIQKVIASGEDPHACDVLVEAMLDGKFLETVVGVTQDPIFGHVLTFGLGGISVELFRDVSRRMLPLTRDSAEAMVDETRCGQLLSGFRGHKGYDRAGLIDALLRISGLVAAHRDSITELEINPLAVTESGGAVALDVLLSRRN